MRQLRTHHAARLAAHAADISLAVPQVIAHRTLRMATAGLVPSARDQAEFMRMGSEKVAAFYESWAAIWGSVVASQWQLAQTMTAAAVQGKPMPAAALAQAMAAAGSRALAAGVAPVRHKAVSNARRLGKTRG